MKKQTMMIAASLAGALALVGTTTAQSPQSGEAFVLEMLGQRGWEVSCRLNQDDGDVIESRERGRGLHDNGRFAVADVTGGLCSYSVPERGELIDCQLDDGKAVEFIIRDGDPRRVKSLDIRLIGSP